jgi:membrane protein implicated in regulation of membrane protease activity
MGDLWTVWWAWGAAALALAILEVFAPGFILLGFAIGAAVVSVLLLIGGPVAAWLAASWPMTVLMFAVFSLVGWIVLRRVAGVRQGQTKLWDTDINDN